MTHGSLFSGIGGFDLAAQWMGWENVFHCELKTFCQTIIKKYWPNSTIHNDITDTDFTVYRDRIDILTGGWPCQDNSRAKQMGGKGNGLKGKRSSLFFEFERAICEIRPKYVVSENVPDVLTINGGGDFNYILSSMAKMGYNVTWGLLRASDIGAPHHRERLYMVAYPSGERLQTLQSIWSDAREKVGEKIVSRLFDGAFVSTGGSWKSRPDLLRVDDGLPNRAHRFTALGNAIVPQIAFEIFKAIDQYENDRKIPA